MTTPEQSPPSSSPTTRREPVDATGGLDPDPPDPGALGGLDPYPPDPGLTLRTVAPHAFLVMGLLLVAIVAGGSVMLLVLPALMVLAAWAAWMLAGLDARHRPIAIGLGAWAALALLVQILHVTILHGGPYAGWARVAFHVEEGTRLATAALPAWMAVAVMTRCPPEPSFRRWARGALWTCYVGAWAGLVGGYPELRGDALRRVYLGAELVALLVAVVAILSWLRKCVALRRGVVVTNLMRPPWFTWGTVLAIVVGDLVLLGVGAWRYGLFGDAYVVQQAGLLGVWGVVALLQGTALVMARRARS